MKGTVKRVQYKSATRNVGQRPGSINIDPNALKPIVTVYSYNQHELIIDEGKDIKVVLSQLDKCKDHTHWIRVQGLGDPRLLRDIGNHLDINDLVLEDIVNTHQRPKFDEYEGFVFAVSRIIRFSEDNELINCQFSSIVKENIIITFEETYADCFEAVKARLKRGKGGIRTGGPAYMCYALTDTILDVYFTALAKIGDTLDTLEDKLYNRADKSIMYDAQQIKRSLIILRRATWPERDKINDILRTDNHFISLENKMFLRDAYDHCVQIMDLIENYKEITSSVIDLYLSMVSNRMNEIMKVLTIISAIFIPLTFIAGVYGMNFSRVDPDTGKSLPDNMPELYSEHGYYYAVAAMLGIALVQVIIFWRKGWFSKL